MEPMLLQIDWLPGVRGAERLLVVLGGIACLFLGYKLFRHQVPGAVDLQVQSGEHKLTMHNASPGALVFFFGAGILIFSIVSPFSYQHSDPETGEKSCG